MKISILGSTGRIGSLVASTARDMDIQVVGTASKGCPVSDLFRNADVIIDFSSPEATLEMLSFALTGGLTTPIVIGTTGLDASHGDLIKSLSAHCPVFTSSNMSVGVAILNVLVYMSARFLDDNFDAEIIDIHHNLKKDSPSGTALMLGETIAKARGQCFQEVAKFTRFGKDDKREKGEIGFAVQRLGDQVGTHEVCFGNAQESIKLRHESYSREGFARGAIVIAEWIIKEKAGLYTMNDFVKSKIVPIVASISENFYT
ncbi:MAG: 4-hydroxy-tetrahydrodipicolinate reductase [Holosporales bacterium]|jgi:4-hydroxy-tetrahydrodipicolinate reductase|nr:4-hydroxy-tetrahydrodipicolinate reductase [Holosporales bacterium]